MNHPVKIHLLMRIHMHRKLVKIILLNYPLPEGDFYHNVHFQNDFQMPTAEIFFGPKLAHYTKTLLETICSVCKGHHDF